MQASAAVPGWMSNEFPACSNTCPLAASEKKLRHTVMKKITLFFLSIICATYASAQIDVDAELTKRIEAKNLASIVANGNNSAKIYLRSLEYDIVGQTNFKLIDESLIKLPDTYSQEVKAMVNCTPTARAWTEQFSLKVETGYGITFTENIQTKKTLQVNAGIQTNIGSFGTIKGNEITISQTKQKNIEHTSTSEYSKSITTTLAPNEKLYIKATTITEVIRVPFECKILLDGDAKFDIHTITPCGSIFFGPAPCYQIASRPSKKISDLLSEEERTFYIRGFLQNATASDAKLNYDSQSLTPQKCDSIRNIEFPQNVQPATTSSNRPRESTIVSSDRLITQTPRSQQSSLVSKEEYEKLRFNMVIEDYNDAITITTGNVYSKIEVRHWSFGPGFCNVIARTPSARVGLNAPPFSWSGWQLLTNHIGSITTTITNEVNCDTGVKSQVRYFKD